VRTITANNIGEGGSPDHAKFLGGSDHEIHQAREFIPWTKE